MDVLDTGDGGPEFVLTEPRGGPSGLAARVGEGPLVGRHTGRRVRGVFERVIRAVELAGFDCGKRVSPALKIETPPAIRWRAVHSKRNADC